MTIDELCQWTGADPRGDYGDTDLCLDEGDTDREAWAEYTRQAWRDYEDQYMDEGCAEAIREGEAAERKEAAS